MNNFLYIWYTEFCNIVHDKGIMIFIFFVPLFYPLLYSAVYTNEVVRDVPAVVVDKCNSALSRELIQKIDATPDVKVITHGESINDAEEFMKRHLAYGIIEIPESFNRDILHGDETNIGLFCDMSSMLYYKALLLAATDVSLNLNEEIKVRMYVNPTTNRDEEIARTPVTYEHLSIFNPQSGFASFLIPPVLMLIIQQTLLLGIGMLTGSIREENKGSIIPFNHRYKNVFNIVGARSLVFFMIYFILSIYMFTCMNNWFQLPHIGRYSTLLAFIVPYILACTFFAMTLSALIFRREDCILIFVFMSVPMLFLSGVSWPSSAMPAFWKYFSYLFPSSFGMNGYIHIMSMGCTLSDTKTEIIGLWIQVFFYFTTAVLTQFLQIKKLRNKLRTK